MYMHYRMLLFQIEISGVLVYVINLLQKKFQEMQIRSKFQHVRNFSQGTSPVAEMSLARNCVKMKRFFKHMEAGPVAHRLFTQIYSQLAWTVK